MTRRKLLTVVWGEPHIVSGVTLLLVLLCLLPFLRILLSLHLRVPLDDGDEGWNAYFAAAAMSGGQLYPDQHSYMVNNYPPLSFYLVGAIGTLLGDNMLAGRIISVLAFLVLAGTVWFAARRMNCGNRAASFAAVLLGSYLIAFSEFVGLNYGQLIGQASGMGGVILLLREPRSYQTLFWAALLLSVGFFVKHNLIVLPIVLTLWLFWFDRRSALWLATFGLIFLICGLIACRLAYGTDLLSQLNSARRYIFSLQSSDVGYVQGSWALRTWLYCGFLPLLVTGWLCVLAWRDKYVVLCVIYVVTASLIGAFFMQGEGVGLEVMFDADIALCLAAALFVSRSAKKGIYQSIVIIPVYVVVPLICLLRMAECGTVRCNPQNLADEFHERASISYWINPLTEEAGVAARDIAFLRERAGPVLCATLTLCYWADKDPRFDLFNVGEQFLLQRRSDEELVSAVKRQQFAALAFASLEDVDRYMTPDVREAIQHYYRIDHVDNEGVFLLPSAAAPP
jgi:hypothetical protein